MKEAADRGSLLGEPPAADHDRFGSNSEFGAAHPNLKCWIRSGVARAGLAAETIAIGELNGRLRAVHLAARLETRALPGPQQLALYQQLRERRKQGTSSPPRLSVGAKCMRVTRAC
jgi:hypothetical protein